MSIASGIEIFGPDAAELDRHLASYFIETSAWRNVSNSHTLVVLGRKGAGKSAIFRILKERPPDNTLVATASPKSFALDIFNQYIREYPTSPFNREVAYATAWKYSLLLEALLAIEKDGPVFKVGNAAGVHDWLSKNVDFDTDIISRTIAFLNSWRTGNVKVSALGVEIDRNKKTIKHDLIGHDIERTLPNLESILRKKKMILAIDNLDEGWSDTPEQRAYLVGLVLAAKELSTVANFRVTLFMRTDAFRSISSNYHHLDKLRDAIETISWTPTSLKSLVCQRIRHYYHVSKEDNDLTWSRVFPEHMKNGFAVYKHIVERTLLRPREILQFCRLIVDSSLRYKKDRTNERDIIEAESAYSAWKIDDLAGEYSGYYQNTKQFLLAFRRAHVNLTSPELLSDVRNALKVSDLMTVEGKLLSELEGVRLLYQMGFLRAIQRDARGRSRYVASANSPDLLVEQISDWQIHPAFRAMIIIGPRARTLAEA